MNTSKLEVTAVEIILSANKTPDTKATVSIVFNECLLIDNLTIVKGQYGHFIHYPSQFDILNHSVSKEVSSTILKAYAKELSKNLPVGGN